ncbi:MAG: hypothetical protein AB7O45_13250 [Alphaproteobacteria bacterium]
MAVALFAPYNWAHEDGVAIAGGSWGPSADTLLSALLNSDTLHKARSIGTTLGATKYTVDLGATRRMDTVFLGYHNGTKDALVRMTFSGAPPAFDHDFMAQTLPSGWTFARATSGTFQDAAGILSYAGIDTPRWDHRGGNLRGLLFEEARENLQARSQELATSPWSVDASWISVVANDATAPDNTATADKIVESSNNTFHGHDGGGMTYAAATTYTVSLFVKPNGRWLILRPFDGAVTHWAYFDPSTGTIGNVRSGDVARIEPWFGGYYRCSITFTTTTGGGGGNSFFLATANGTDPNPSYAGDGASGCWAWGAQVEVGAWASAYIPTAGSAATRARDQLYIDTLLLPWWSSLPITAHVKARRPFNRPSNEAGSGNFSPALSVWNGASHATFSMGFSPEYGGAGTSMKVHAGYHSGANLGGDDVGADVSVSMAAAFQSGDSAMSVDGDPVTTAATAFSAAAATRIHIGGQGAGDGAVDGWIERVSLWTARLANARLVDGTVAHSDFGGIVHQTAWLDIVPTTHAPSGGHLPFGRVAADGKLPDDERDPRGASILIDLGQDVDAQAVLVEFDDTTNPAGYFEHSVIVLAKSERWESAIESGFAPGSIHDSHSERDSAGGLWSHENWRRRTFEVVLPWQHVDRALAQQLEQRIRVGNVLPVLFAAQIFGGIHDPRLVYYGVLRSPSAVQHARHVRFGAAFNIEEL